MVKILKSATVTKSLGKLREWNEVNPLSEKLKFGRGILQDEMKLRRNSNVDK
jgi:hypothetical protein